MAIKDQEGRTKLYADIAHPINSECREMIQDRVIADYQREVEQASEPGYVSRYDEGYEFEPMPHTPPRGESSTANFQRGRDDKSGQRQPDDDDTTTPGFGTGVFE